MITLPGSAATDALRSEATRIFNVDGRRRLSFQLPDGEKLALGVAICESPLANANDSELPFEVTVRAAPWWQESDACLGSIALSTRMTGSRLVAPIT